VAAFALDFPVCPTAGMWGVPCPSCGLTRASVALLSGDLAAAHQHHPLVWLLGPVLLGALFSFGIAYLRGSDVAPLLPAAWSRWLTRAAAPLGALLMLTLTAVWIARFYGHFGGPAPVTSFAEWFGADRTAAVILD
jgi:hypothetical protein